MKRLPGRLVLEKPFGWLALEKPFGRLALEKLFGRLALEKLLGRLALEKLLGRLALERLVRESVLGTACSCFSGFPMDISLPVTVNELSNSQLLVRNL